MREYTMIYEILSANGIWHKRISITTDVEEFERWHIVVHNNPAYRVIRCEINDIERN